jgi:N-acyl-D-aspartate/D-glutamate deacylase
MPRPPEDGPPSVVRRRLLVALGFGATTAVVAGRLRVPPQTAPPAGTAGAYHPAVPLAARASQDQPAPDPPAMADAAPEPPEGHVFDLVIAGARVIDPETGFDAVVDVGVDGGVITGLAARPLQGRDGIDGRGKVVAPGFIDLLSYEPNPLGAWNKVADGVTSNLGMHGISNVASRFFDRFEGQVPLHFGGAFHNAFVRGWEPFEIRIDRPASAEERQRLVDRFRRDLDAGFAGINFSPEYTPGVDRDEILALAQAAADAGQVCFFHARYSSPHPPGSNAEALAEVIDVARRTGASVHVNHLTSTGGTFTMARSLATLEAARAEGLDVTACMYPYDFWATYLASERFAEGWQERFRIGVEDLQIAGTTTRVTPATFEAFRRENKLVAALGSIPEADVRAGLAVPWMMMGSDAILQEGANNHPRASGTFCRLLGHYVRDLGVLPLADALAKMTILPAKRLEGMIPALARKGRLQRGADADLVVIDPATVADRATVEDPSLTSVGIDAVLVGGRPVLRDGALRRSELPGQALRSA